jgi:hypothetical protein
MKRGRERGQGRQDKEEKERKLNKTNAYPPGKPVNPSRQKQAVQ